MKAPIFVYGTLCNIKVVQTLLGRSLAKEMQNTGIYGYSRHPVKDRLFPGIIPTPDEPYNRVNGYLIHDLSDLERQIFDWYEGDEYDRKQVQVSTGTPGDNDMVDAEACIWKPHLVGELGLDEEWSYDKFCKENLEQYLKKTVRPCRIEMEQLGLTNEK